MLEDPISVVIGGKTFVCPPMPFYCLERAWPHIQRLGRMGQINQTLVEAQFAARNAMTPEQQQAAQASLTAAEAMVEREGADFIGQTREAIHIIVAALALDTPPPSYEALSRHVQPTELAGIHIACSLLMEGSGLHRTAPGEAEATAKMMPVPLNGAGSSLN